METEEQIMAWSDQMNAWQREVADSRAAELLDANAWYADAEGRPVPALQLVWSDPDGRLPWEPGYSLAAHLQPIHATRST